MVILDPDNNENNQNNQTSEQKLSDRVYAKGVKPELSPNPKFSGFTKQYVIELKNGTYGYEDIIDVLLSDHIILSESVFFDENEVEHPLEPNILFIVKIGNETQYYTVVDPKPQGDETPAENLIRVYPEYPSVDAREPGKTPTPALVKGNNTPNLKENQAPRKRPRVFSEPVAFQDDVFVKGKLLGVEFKQIAVGQYRSDVIVDPGSGRTNYGINFVPQEWIEFNNWGDATEEEIAQLQKAMADFKQKIKNADLIIFTMNNTFVISPVAQNGDTLMLGNFAYNSRGDTTIARLRLKFHDEGVAVLFDDEFGETMQVAPYGALLVVNF